MYCCTSGSEGQGQPLVEVFGVHFLHGGQALTGTVSVFDGKRGQILYSGDEPYSRETQRSGRLPLTGPYRAISADGSVAIVLDLHHQDNASPTSSSPSSYVAEVLLDVYDEATKYDELITSVVSSTRGDGRVEVTYALLSDAAEATIEVRLLGERPGRTVGGKVVARTDLGEVVLFEDDDASVGTGTEEEPANMVPLPRSVVAVLLGSSLTVEVNLVVVDDDGQEDVTEAVVCVPELGSEKICQCVAVEVKITWLD